MNAPCLSPDVGRFLSIDPVWPGAAGAIGYNTYNLEAKGMEFKEDERFSIVGGVRARSETFAGVIEGTLGLGEIGLRVAVMFGF